MAREEKEEGVEEGVGERVEEEVGPDLEDEAEPVEGLPGCHAKKASGSLPLVLGCFPGLSTLSTLSIPFTVMRTLTHGSIFDE